MRQRTSVGLRLPGWIASVAMILLTVLWTFWGAAEMYHEGWWGAWTNRLPYLAPIAATLLPTLVAFRWPLAGGVSIALVGLVVASFFGGQVAVIGLVIVGLGALFVVDGVVRRQGAGAAAPRSSWRRRWRYVLVVGLPAIVFAGVSAAMLPVVLTRVDDGDCSARLIEGNGVSLLWAPAGPGWNWRQPWGGYPSWQSIALYGVPPLGLGDKAGYGRLSGEDGTTVFATDKDMERTNLCLYLSPDGARLLEEPLGIWRMPTADEIVRSLGRHGANAGCRWRGETGGRVSCHVRPDKESPLWSSTSPAIYYWAAEAESEQRAYFVAYNGTVNATYKLGGNPRHGYRCVREP